jgi:hypothetical protein
MRRRLRSPARRLLPNQAHSEVEFKILKSIISDSSA